MSRNLAKEQLQKVEVADLSQYNSETRTYFIPQKKEIKIEEESCYLIHLKPTAFLNVTIKINWNQGKEPPAEYLKVEVSKKMANMIKVVAIGYNYETQQDMGVFWNGWLSLDDIEVLAKL